MQPSNRQEIVTMIRQSSQYSRLTFPHKPQNAISLMPLNDRQVHKNLTQTPEKPTRLKPESCETRQNPTQPSHRRFPHRPSPSYPPARAPSGGCRGRLRDPLPCGSASPPADSRARCVFCLCSVGLLLATRGCCRAACCCRSGRCRPCRSRCHRRTAWRCRCGRAAGGRLGSRR